MSSYSLNALRRLVRQVSGGTMKNNFPSVYPAIFWGEGGQIDAFNVDVVSNSV